MTRTANLDLPLVEAAQAQKHVTVNEALSLLDGVCQLTIESLTSTNPPQGAVDGQTWAVPSQAQGDWTNLDGTLAIFSNGGWVHVTPQRGWRGWVKDLGTSVIFDGGVWASSAAAVSWNGAATLLEIVETEIDISAGSTVMSAAIIPATSVVFGVTGRVTSRLTGSLTSWQLGIPGQPNRYGSSLGTAKDSLAMGLSGQPQSYYAPTALQLLAEGGNFASGQVRLAVHLMRLSEPRR